MTKGLFGGALFAAGMASAALGDFDVNANYSFTSMVANDFATSGYDLLVENMGISSIDETFAYTGVSGNAMSELTTTSLSASIDINGMNGFAFSRAYAVVTVDEPTDITAEWDFVTPNLSYADLYVLNVTTQSYLVNATPNTTGSESVTLMPDNEYALFTNADSDAPANVSASITIDDAAACPADLTGDQTVNVFDLLELLGQWGTCSPGDCPADLTDDGTVNVFDLLDLLGQWGSC